MVKSMSNGLKVPVKDAENVKKHFLDKNHGTNLYFISRERQKTNHERKKKHFKGVGKKMQLYFF